MSIKMHSATIICSADDRDLVDRLSCALGHAPYDHGEGVAIEHTMVVPLSASAAAPATHYGAHTRADDDFIGLFRAGASGDVPERPQAVRGWSDFGLTADTVSTLMPRLRFVVVHDTFTAASWAEALDDAGLSRMVASEE